MILGLLGVGLITFFLYLVLLLARRSEWAACTWPAFTEVLNNQKVGNFNFLTQWPQGCQYELPDS